MFKKLQKKKDAFLSAGLKTYANRQLDGLGEVLRIELNSKARTLNAQVAVPGENRLLEVSLNRYRIYQRDEHWLVRIDGVRTSHETLTEQLNAYLQEQDIVLPRKLAPLLKALA